MTKVAAMSAPKHQHGACVACFHGYAHGVYDGYSLAVRALFKQPGSDVLIERQERDVNRSVRSLARMLGIESGDLEALMRHHKKTP